MAGTKDIAKPLENNGNIAATLLNVCSSVELRIKNFMASKDQVTFMGADANKCKKVESATDKITSYMFGPLDLPGLLKDTLFMIANFMHYIDEEGDHYVMTVDIREFTGETYCNYQCKLAKDTFESIGQVYNILKGE